MTASKKTFPGITALPNGKYLVRAYKNGHEISRRFDAELEGAAWKSKTEKILEELPQEISHKNKMWIVAITTPAVIPPKRFKEYEDAVLFFRKAKDSLKAGSYQDEEQMEITLREFVVTWRKTKNRAGSRTMFDYESLWKTRIEPALGDYKLVSITHEIVTDWINDLLKRGIGPSRTRKSAMLLKQILRLAVNRRLIATNPVNGVELPALEEREQIALEVPQLIALANEAGRYRFLFLFLGFMGLRISEALALRVEDINFERWEVKVKRAWTKDEDGRRAPGKTKTRRIRVIPVPSNLREGLLLQAQGKGKRDELFTGTKGGVVNDGWLRRGVLKPATAKLGLEGVTLHTFRHTCASLLIQSGSPITAVSAILGHKSVTMTLNKYSHYYKTDLVACMDSLGQHDLAA